MNRSRPPEDIDPKTEYVLPKRRRRLRNRSRPEPPAQLKAEESKASARALKRPLSPGIMYEQEGEDFYATAPHSDIDLWELQIRDAFGTRSQSVAKTFLEQLRHLVPEVWVEGAAYRKPHETELNAALAMVADVQPRNVIEAALAAQMVAVHWLQMRTSAQALAQNCRVVLKDDAALAGKLARTYAIQVETLAKLRGKRASRQTIRVHKELHQNVYYHDHRGAGENDSQPHAPNGDTIGGRPALPSPDQGGEVVRLPVRKRKARV